MKGHKRVHQEKTHVDEEVMVSQYFEEMSENDDTTDVFINRGHDKMPVYRNMELLERRLTCFII